MLYILLAKQLIEGMMKVDPAHRLTSKEILFHPWIKVKPITDYLTKQEIIFMKDTDKDLYNCVRV